MKKSEIDDIFQRTYLSALQIGVKLADPQNLLCELGRSSGKTTHIMAARMDRVQNSMSGALLTLGAATYCDIFDNILPGLLEYFNENYERGMYFEVGKEPPKHFKKCVTSTFNWKHSISFVTGTVIKFVSADRPESVLGINAAHSFWDELLKIKKNLCWNGQCRSCAPTVPNSGNRLTSWDGPVSHQLRILRLTRTGF